MRARPGGPSAQHRGERAREIGRLQRFAQHHPDAERVGLSFERRCAETAAQDDRKVVAPPREARRELQARQVRHRMVGHDDVEAGWIGIQGSPGGLAR